MAIDLHKPKDRAKYRKSLFKRRDKFFEPASRQVASALNQIGVGVVAAIKSSSTLSLDKVNKAIQDGKPRLKKSVEQVWLMAGSDAYSFAASNFGGTLYGSAPKAAAFTVTLDTESLVSWADYGAANIATKQFIPAWMTYVADYMTTGKVGDRRIDDMTHETEQRVQTALFAGMEQQEGQPQLALRVQALFDDMSEGRARVIAKSETVDAYNQATLQQGKDAGSTLDLMWIATGDDSTRPEHEAMDGVQVPHDQEFECEDGTTMPGEAVNCRCCLGYAQPEE